MLIRFGKVPFKLNYLLINPKDLKISVEYRVNYKKKLYNLILTTTATKIFIFKSTLNVV